MEVKLKPLLSATLVASLFVIQPAFSEPVKPAVPDNQPSTLSVRAGNAKVLSTNKTGLPDQSVHHKAVKRMARKNLGKKLVWSSKLALHPVDKVRVCMMATQPLTLFDGEGYIRLQIIYANDKLAVVTNANVDPSYKDVGLTIDEKDTFIFDEYKGKKTAVIRGFSGDRFRLFSNGLSAELKLGFWPTWPKTVPGKIRISLMGFKKQHRKYKECINNLLN